ncbi:hypothetical protein AVEN_62255-1, partial [Araneus ventricosus]
MDTTPRMKTEKTGSRRERLNETKNILPCRRERVSCYELSSKADYPN